MHHLDGVMRAIRTKHVYLKKKLETIRFDTHFDRQFAGFGNYVEQFDNYNARDQDLK